MPEVTIIGAGISGLSCAWALKKLGIDAVVLEASARPGGVICTEKINGYQIEWGPGSLQPAPAALKLIDEVGLWDDLLPPDPQAPRFIYVNGRLRKFPFGPLTFGGIARILSEPFIRSKAKPDESVRDFIVRRFGVQAHDRLAGPLFTGIYATDTAQLSMAAVLPRMLDMERQYGSLTGAMLRSFSKKSPAAEAGKPRPRGFTLSFSEGMEALPKRLAENVAIQYEQHDVRTGSTPVTVLAVPAYAAFPLVQQGHPGVATLLKDIRYSPIIVAATSVAVGHLPEPLKGFGFLVPRSERLHLLGTIFSSALFPGRAPGGQLLLSSFIGGSFEPEVMNWSDDKVWETVCSELKSVLRADAAPEPIGLRRHQYALPQYRIGHERLIASLKSELQQAPGLFIASNYMEGASVPACIEQAERTARQIAEYLGKA